MEKTPAMRSSSLQLSKEEKRKQRLERARKRDWKNSSHGEQFAAIDEALKPIQAAKDGARKEGASRQLRADLEEGEGAFCS